MILRNKSNSRREGPGQPRIDPEAPLERRSVGLPVSWWAAIDRLAKVRGVKASVVVRAAVGVELRRVGRIEQKMGQKKAGKKPARAD